MSSATAAWTLDYLVDSLARVGWGPLGGGRKHSAAKTTLKALRALLPWGSATARVTHSDIAEKGDCHPRTVQRGLRDLVALGLVEYRPGGRDPRTGRTWPSRVRVIKTALAAAIRAAGERRDNRPAPAPVVDTKSTPHTHREDTRGAAQARPRRTPQAAATLAGPPERSSAIPPPTCDVCGRSAARCLVANLTAPAHRRHEFVPLRT